MNRKIETISLATVYICTGLSFFMKIPKFVAIYEDLYGDAGALPSLTQLVINTPPSLFLASACLMAGLICVLNIKYNTFLINLSFLILWGLTSAVLVMAIFRPLIVIIEELN